MSQSKKSFTDYEGFVEKFKTKLTTDDCYTPPAVYDTVLQWLRENADIEGREIVRPFYPGGDFENFDYPDGCVVVDNPPFSIYSKIVRFYIARGIRFFLFAPCLSTFVRNADYTTIIANVHVTYENGAKVNTNFVTNLFDYRFWLCGELRRRIKAVQPAGKTLRGCLLPNTVLSSARLTYYINDNSDFRVGKDEATIPRAGIKAQKVFGSCVLVGRHIAARLKAERERIEKEQILRAVAAFRAAKATSIEKTSREEDANVYLLDDEENAEIEQLTKP